MLSGLHDPGRPSYRSTPALAVPSPWAQMLMRMYLRWCERSGFKAEIVDLLPGEEAGIKSATIEVTGEYAYGYLKGEAGVHRLIHLAVRRLQPPSDLVRLGVGGAGSRRRRGRDPRRRSAGRRSAPPVQAARASTPPTPPCGSRTCRPTSSSRARTSARSPQPRHRPADPQGPALYELAEKKQKADLAELTGAKKEIAFGSQIRSYTFHPQQRIKDHRTNLEVGNVEAVMDGDIDEFIKAYLLWSRSHGA